MAITKLLQDTVLQIEVENGTDDLGNTLYKKKNFSKIKEEATEEQIFNVAEDIKSILAANTVAYFLEQSFIMSNDGQS